MNDIDLACEKRVIAACTYVYMKSVWPSSFAYRSRKILNITIVTPMVVGLAA